MPKTTGRSAKINWLIKGLEATGPHLADADKLALFGQFVGDWDITEWRTLEKDGSWSTGKGELHWRWILDGRAVQDVWSTYDKDSDRFVPLGTTLRFYDPKIDAWHSVWVSPVNNVLRPFLARPVGSEIVLEGKNARGNSIHWIFSEITARSFRWRAEELRTGLSEWVMNEEMRIRRQIGTYE